MLADLSALFYLEYRQIVNRMRQMLRQPARALVYLCAAAYFILIAFARAHGRSSMPVNTIPEPYASAAMFTYVALLGIVAYGAASGIVGTFSSPADARFLIGSVISQRTIVVWLQLRRSANSMARMLLTLVLYLLVVDGSKTFAGVSLATLGGTLFASAIAVPMLKIRAITGTRTAQSLAGVIAALGLLPMLVLLSGELNPTRLSAGIERLGAGAAFNQLFIGNALALAALYACGAVLIGLAFAAGTNLYPDLYAASLRVLEFRARQKRGPGAAFAIQHVYVHHADKPAKRFFFDALRGAWTIAWKEWIAFLRSQSMQRMFWFGLIMCAATGAFFGTVAARSTDPVEDSLQFASLAANMIVIFVAMGSAIGLASDLSKPLWWIGPDTLWMRLVAWTAGTSWRLAACVCCGVIGWSLPMRAPEVAFYGVPLSIVGVLHLRAVGLALYALFPSSIDQRGPLAMVRALLTYLLAAPPVIVGTIIGLVFHTLVGGFAAGAATSLIETLGLIAFASGRIDGRGIAVAQAESY